MPVPPCGTGATSNALSSYFWDTKLVSGGPYTLKVLCPLVGENQRACPPPTNIVKDVPIQAVKHPLPQTRQVLSLDVINGWQYKINHWTATQDELDRWKVNIDYEARRGWPNAFGLGSISRTGSPAS